MGYNEKLLKLIIKNLPKKYDLSKFSREILDQMLVLAKINVVVSACLDKTIIVWNVDTGDIVHTLNNTDKPWCVVASPDNNHIAAAFCDGIKIWDIFTGQLIKNFNSTTSMARCLAYSPDGKQIVFGTTNYSVNILDVESGQILKMFKTCEFTFSVCYSSDGHYVASGGDDNYIHVWEAISGDHSRVFHGHKGDVWSVYFSHDSRFVASASDDHNIMIWAMKTGYLSNMLSGHTGIVNSICYLSNDERIISGSCDNTIRIWHKSGTLINTLRGHTDSVLCVKYSPDDKLIISSSHDRSIKIWNATTGELIKTLNGHTDLIWSVCCAIIPDSNLVNRIMQVINKN
jgi:WD40 repeat protein